jgi:hypothetical protein
LNVLGSIYELRFNIDLFLAKNDFVLSFPEAIVIEKKEVIKT